MRPTGCVTGGQGSEHQQARSGSIGAVALRVSARPLVVSVSVAKCDVYVAGRHDAPL